MTGLRQHAVFGAPSAEEEARGGAGSDGRDWGARPLGDHDQRPLRLRIRHILSGTRRVQLDDAERSVSCERNAQRCTHNFLFSS